MSIPVTTLSEKIASRAKLLSQAATGGTLVPGGAAELERIERVLDGGPRRMAQVHLPVRVDPYFILTAGRSAWDAPLHIRIAPGADPARLSGATAPSGVLCTNVDRAQGRIVPAEDWDRPVCEMCNRRAELWLEIDARAQAPGLDWREVVARIEGFGEDEELQAEDEVSYRVLANALLGNVAGGAELVRAVLPRRPELAPALVGNPNLTPEGRATLKDWVFDDALQRRDLPDTKPGVLLATGPARVAHALSATLQRARELPTAWTTDDTRRLLKRAERLPEANEEVGAWTIATEAILRLRKRDVPSALLTRWHASIMDAGLVGRLAPERVRNLGVGLANHPSASVDLWRSLLEQAALTGDGQVPAILSQVPKAMEDTRIRMALRRSEDETVLRRVLNVLEGEEALRAAERLLALHPLAGLRWLSGIERPLDRGLEMSLIAPYLESTDPEIAENARRLIGRFAPDEAISARAEGPLW